MTGGLGRWPTGGYDDRWVGRWPTGRYDDRWDGALQPRAPGRDEHLATRVVADEVVAAPVDDERRQAAVEAAPRLDEVRQAGVQVGRHAAEVEAARQVEDATAGGVEVHAGQRAAING